MSPVPWTCISARSPQKCTSPLIPPAARVARLIPRKRRPTVVDTPPSAYTNANSKGEAPMFDVPKEGGPTAHTLSSTPPTTDDPLPIYLREHVTGCDSSSP